MTNSDLQKAIFTIILMAIFFLLININVRLETSNNYSKEYIDADWCSSEIDILREQISDIWYEQNLNE